MFLQKARLDISSKISIKDNSRQFTMEIIILQISSSYLDLYLYIDNRRLTIRLYDKRDDFTFPLGHVSFLSSNIPSALAMVLTLSIRTLSNEENCSLQDC